MENDVDNWEFHLRILSSSLREASLSSSASSFSSDPSILESVKKLNDICKSEDSEDLIAKVYPVLNKLFQRTVASVAQSQTPHGLLLLAILQFFLDCGEHVLHDADSSLRAYFRSCLSREFADTTVAEATLNFLNVNRAKLLNSFPALLPQFFPLFLKLIGWNGEQLEKPFLNVFPGIVSPSSFLPLFPSLVDFPLLVVALEKVERSSGSLIGSGIASIQKSTAPEMLLALMEEAYTGSTIEDRGGDSGSDDSVVIDVADSLFLDLLKDENDGLAEKHWTSPAIALALQAAIKSPPSGRLRQALNMAPQLLDLYFSIALRDANDSLICALIPLLMSRNSKLFPDTIFSYEEEALRIHAGSISTFSGFIALLKKPIMDRLGEALDNPAKMELALQLCWAIGEHGGGGIHYSDAARELFESLELLLYENISSSRLGTTQGSASIGDGATFRRSSQTRLLCFVVTAIAKLATYHRDLLPRARVSLAKVAHSRNSDTRVWRRARDYLGLMNEPAICLSILGPSSDYPGTVNWKEGGSKMISNIPFYILGTQGGSPFHDFSFSDIFPSR